LSRRHSHEHPVEVPSGGGGGLQGGGGGLERSNSAPLPAGGLMQQLQAPQQQQQQLQQPQSKKRRAASSSHGGPAAPSAAAALAPVQTSQQQPASTRTSTNTPLTPPTSTPNAAPAACNGAADAATPTPTTPTSTASSDTAIPDPDPQQQQQGQQPPARPSRGPLLGSTPVHTAGRFSLLSSERVWHEKHTGLYNLALIILVLTNFRLALENALKYGWRLNPVVVVGDLLAGRGGSLGAGGGVVNVPLVATYPCLLAAAGLSWGVEVAGWALLAGEMRLRDRLSKRSDLPAPALSAALASRARAHEWLLFLLNTATTSCVIGLPWAVIYLTKAEPISGGILIGLAVVLWMKLVSYHHCCADLRQARRAGELRPGERGSADTPAGGAEWGPLARYPENLTARNMLYFLAVPTLTYQVNYPRSRSIRGRWLLRRCFELAISLTALAIIIGQYIQPTVNNSMGPLRQMDLPRVVERVLKLALPSTYAWLLLFYALFHLWLNVLAELTRFGDREFYKDWWNAATVGEYWKLWNMPVHRWLLRHVYFPAIRAGWPRFWSVVLTFFVSAVFHELVLGVPLHLVRLWAFGGIMFQVPLIMATEKLRKRLNRDELGNYIFWIAFCVVGQPVCVLLYYHDYMVGIRPALLALRADGG
ncbi:hypothetical protein Agub_g10091, partial [Astrephomene gubernaculifera]